jgi:uncharacterized protein (TIGR03437 family)
MLSFAIHEDGAANSKDNPAAAGLVVALYITGAGGTPIKASDGAAKTDGQSLLLPVTAHIGGQPADVIDSGADGVPEGVMLLKLRTPVPAPTGSSVPLVVHIGDQISQPGVTIAIR